MTAETEGSVQFICAWKDIEGLDILQRNVKSFMVCSEAEFNRAVEALAGEETIWVHDVTYRNADNRITFRTKSSSAWTAKDGKLHARIDWPLPACQGICHPCDDA